MLGIDAPTIQIILQSGALGLMLVFGVCGYNLAKLAINKGFEFITNHLAHNTEAIKEGTEVMREMKTEIARMSDKLDK